MMSAEHVDASSLPFSFLGTPPPRSYMLVDCDNFYVSCESNFNASIANRPVVVLGNGDGCIVARSNAAKDLGFPMGAPAFQYRQLIEQAGVIVFSSNYPLYQDFSDRVMRILATFTPRLEVYSIDEAWLDVSHIEASKLFAYGQKIRATVLRYTGIPVSVGVASSKSLCKIATLLVKKDPNLQGVLNLVGMTEEDLDELLSMIHVEDLWKIGKASAITLQQHGILSAKALKYAEARWIRRHLRVDGERIVWELRGHICYPLETKKRPQKGIMTALSFGRPVERLEELEEATATYTVRCAEKLRRQESTARTISVFLHTNPFAKSDPQYAASISRTLLLPTAWTPTLMSTALELLHFLYKPGYRYKRAGVYLTQLHPQEISQADLFGLVSLEQEAKQMRLMAVVDIMNYYRGKDTIFYGAQGIHRDWLPRQMYRSPRYTTRWDEILCI
jgi:DNA polymerase V